MNDVHSTAQAPRPLAFERWGGVVVARRKLVLVAYIVVLVLSGAFGAQVFGSLKSEGFTDPGSDSVKVNSALSNNFKIQPPAAVLVITTPNGVDSDASTAQQFIRRIEQTPGVERVVSYWSNPEATTLKGRDGRSGQVIVYATSTADEKELSATLVEDFTGSQGSLSILATGNNVVNNTFNEIISADLARAESITIPITALILIFVFGSLVAAGLPYLVAGGTILGTFLTLFLITEVTDVSIFALNLVTGLGLALGIDYSLLIISRFREELRDGRSSHDAVVRTITSAGRTVFVSGITVAIALAALLIYPQYFLRSFAYAGISVSLLAVAGALTAVPALLAMLGPAINKGKVRRGDLAPRDDGLWAKLAKSVMRHPWRVIIGTTAVLLILAIPAFTVVFGQVDDRALPASNQTARAGELLREQFPDNNTAPLVVVLSNPRNAQEVISYAKTISKVAGIETVITPNVVVTDGQIRGRNSDRSTVWVAGNKIRIEATSKVRPVSPEGSALVKNLREIKAPADEVLVGGEAALFNDATRGVLDRTWIVAIWLVITVSIVLFLFTGSVLIPAKALLLNMLSLSATLGAMVWIFQGGHLTWLTGEYTQTGTIDVTTLALVGVIAFALSMDYEVFMLARIKEEHDGGATTTDSVAFGLQRTGRIVTAAAVLIAIVFASFLSSSVTNIKSLGFGVAFAIILDATVVRALLVPAFMRIAGNANWWAPPPLRRLHNRIGLREG